MNFRVGDALNGMMPLLRTTAWWNEAEKYFRMMNVMAKVGASRAAELPGNHNKNVWSNISNLMDTMLVISLIHKYNLVEMFILCLSEILCLQTALEKETFH